MKKIFAIAFGLFTTFGFSQLTLSKLNGTTINNGDVITFTTVGTPESDFGFIIGNSSAAAITVKSKCMGFSNTNGTNVIYCIQPSCVNSVTVGNAFPSAGAVIPAGSTNGDFDHFENLDPGINPTANVDYILKFYQVDHSGNEIGTPISFTYRYTPALSNSDFSAMKDAGVVLKSNLVDSAIELGLDADTQVVLYDLNGKLIKQENLTSGNQLLDVSNLMSGVYILNVKNNQGREASTKIVKK